jgi:hypothetical protein
MLLAAVADIYVPRVVVRRLVVLIVAVLGLSSCTSAGPLPGPSSARPPASPAPLAAPVHLTATTDSQPFEVTITWTIPPEPADLSGWEVVRDSQRVGFLPPESSEFADSHVDPGAAYAYAVSAAAGAQRSEAATLDVKVPRPPLAAARFEGRYRMSGTATSSSGYRTFDGRPSFDWDVVATCGEGACDVRVKMYAPHTFRIKLARHGARYVGSATGKFAVKCDSVVMDSLVEVDVRVVAPIPPASYGPAAREWFAGTLKGTMHESEAPQFGCTGGNATFRITLSSF